MRVVWLGIYAFCCVGELLIGWLKEVATTRIKERDK